MALVGTTMPGPGLEREERERDRGGTRGTRAVPIVCTMTSTVGLHVSRIDVSTMLIAGRMGCLDSESVWDRG